MHLTVNKVPCYKTWSPSARDLQAHCHAFHTDTTGTKVAQRVTLSRTPAERRAEVACVTCPQTPSAGKLAHGLLYGEQRLKTWILGDCQSGLLFRANSPGTAQKEVAKGTGEREGESSQHPGAAPRGKEPHRVTPANLLLGKSVSPPSDKEASNFTGKRASMLPLLFAEVERARGFEKTESRSQPTGLPREILETP